MVEIKVTTTKGLHSILAEEKNTVLQALQAAQIPIQAPCNGRGTCGKCKILVQGEQSERLACQTYPTQHMVIEVKSKAEQMQVVSEFLGGESVVDQSAAIENSSSSEQLTAIVQPSSIDQPAAIEKPSLSEQRPTDATVVNNKEKVEEKPLYMIAVDLGTTTVVIQLLAFDSNATEISKGKVLQTVRNLNPQSIYGADVISRITASNQGAAKALSGLICNFLCDGIEHMCENNDIKLDQISDIVIGGNTTMMHLLREYNVSGLGKYPFQPVSLSLEEFPYVRLKTSAVLDKESGRDIDNKSQIFKPSPCGKLVERGPLVTLFPGISAFVGGDIVAGLYALNIHKEANINLLVDLGTNGELAIGNRERILVTSTAAGPAFEGGNISCGTGSIPGAIKEVTIKKRYVAYQTIDNKPAVGICGTGAIDLLAELWNKGYINEHGSFRDEYRERGFLVEGRGGQSEKEIRFTQEDIRQMQLAKGAIRAGIEVLMETYGVGYDLIGHLYLAGGMGFSLNIEKACEIGLLPPPLKDKVVIVGNSCLGGVIKYLQTVAREKSERRIEDMAGEKLEGCTAKLEIMDMISRTTSIQLAEGDLFAGNYLNYMDFS